MLLETLEDRRLLAVGPQLGGIQPNDGNLLSDGEVRHVAPNELTIRFDRDQIIDPSTLGGIRVIGSGKDGTFNDGNEVTIQPGFIGVNDAPRQNEVVVRFKEVLPDDHYRIEILGTGPNALRNIQGMAFNDLTDDNVDNGSNFQLDFELDLAPQVVAVVPQPILRTASGTLQQERHVIEVYFNDDALFVAKDDLGNPTRESAENPDFYQLIFTNETVRNTDDVVIKPARVRYNSVTNMARLEFGQDLDKLVDPNTGDVIGPATFRLRIGTDEAAPLPPQRLAPVVQVATDFNTLDEVVVQFTAVRSGEDGIALEFTRHDQGGPGDPIVSVSGVRISVDLNSNLGNETTAQQLVDAVNRHPEARRLVAATIISSPESADTNIGAPLDPRDSTVRPINYSPLRLLGLGSSFNTATDLSDNTDLGPVLVITGAGTAFEDGKFFFIKDTDGVERKFEFDSDSPGAMNDPDAVPIPFSPSMALSQVASSIVAAINNASFGVEARLVGSHIELEGDRRVDLSDGVPGLDKRFQTKFDLGQVLRVVGDGTTYSDGQTLTIEDNNGVTQAFEFDAGYVMQVPDGAGINDGETIRFSDFQNPTIVFEFEDTTIGDGISVDSDVAVPFTPDDSQQDVLEALRAAIQNQIDLGNLSRIALRDLGDGQLHLGHDEVVEIEITAAELAFVSEGGAQSADAVPVPFFPLNSFTVNDVARSLAEAVNRASATIASFDVLATAAGNLVRFDRDQFIDLGTVTAGIEETVQARFDTGPVLVITGDGDSSGLRPDSFRDGQTFTIVDDRGVSRLFEFDSDSPGSLNNPGARRIAFDSTMDAAAMSRAIVQAINEAGFRVQATQLGTTIYLTNDREVSLGSTLRGMSRTSQGIIISSAIAAQPFPFDFPGGSDEPGHRKIPTEVARGIEHHINPAFSADVTPGVTTIFYNFQTEYGDSLESVITERQKQRAREAFQIWSHHLGLQFLETAAEGITIVTGETSALDAQLPEVLAYDQQGYRVRIDPLFGNSMLIMDASRPWNDEFGGQFDDTTNPTWFINAMRGIGAMLGLGVANDLPVTTMMADAPLSFPNEPRPEPIYPGNHDIVHGQYLYRPDGVDIDLYRFTIDLELGKEGLFTAETFAERLPNSSLLDTVLRLWRENPDGTRVLVAQNDDYYSRDSYIEVMLGAGTYYIGVSASGNANYDPTIEETGLGGKSQGRYDLRLNFRSQVEDSSTIRDLAPDGRPGVPLDGDADGTPGGVYNFWFQTQQLHRTLGITHDGSTFPARGTTPATGQTFSVGQIVTITNSNGNIQRFEFTRTAGQVGPGNRDVVVGTSDTAEAIAAKLAARIKNLTISGQPFIDDATADGAIVSLRGERYVTVSIADLGIDIHGRTIFVDKTAGPNADGSQQRPFNNIAGSGVTNAFANTHPGDIIRIVGNGGFDNNLSTLSDNFAYEIGFSTLGPPLSDGSTMEVPRGTTVMIEPGTIFKLRRARIGVGSSSLSVDRGGGALQVLGTPQHNVYFTSWLDETIGRDTHPTTTFPSAGDWGGIVFRNDLDNAESRPNLEDEGIFLNYVSHADIRYGGGGNVVVDSIQQIVNPIQMIEARPTITHNRISFSADAAMSADPNSFAETNFHSPRYQRNGEFTSDYVRIGPDIYGNILTNNSTNGLFIRIQTAAGTAPRALTVPGRFDDTDIVHVLAENLRIQGAGGDPFLDLSRPPIDLITFTPLAGGTLAPGEYAYKLVFVDANGFEGRPSNAMPTVTVAAGQGSIRLSQLPPAESGFVARRLYRTDDPVNGVYELVAELNTSDSLFVDRGGSLGAVLERDPPVVEGVTLTPELRGSLPQGVYDYRIVFVDALGNEGASSDPTISVTIDGAPGEGGIRLDNLPQATGQFVSTRIYRSEVGGITPYTLVAEIPGTGTSYLDDGFTLGGTLDASSFGVIRAQLSARLKIDPGTVVKLEGARFDLGFGSQLIAEGTDGREVIFTSRLDDKFGAGGTFDTNNDNNQPGGRNLPGPGDWGGIFLGPLSKASLDHVYIAYGGGVNRIEGTTKAFSVLEVHQAELRLTNSIVENNAAGIGGQGPENRFGRGYNLPATIFVRGAQPIIVNNIIRNNLDPLPQLTNAAITINANSLTHELLVDSGRSTGFIDRVTGYGDNRGPLVRENRLENNGINGMVVRGEVLTTEGIWDDTDIVHVLTDRYNNTVLGRRFQEIVIPNHHTFGGLRLQSSPTESLVVKLEGQGTANDLYNTNPTIGAGFTATGTRFEIQDRIGGILHVIGQPGFPVVLTSINDDTVGAGVMPNGMPQTNTNNIPNTRPQPNDWRGIRLDQFSHDRNVEVILEQESRDAVAPGTNATVFTAQVLGTLSADEKSGDENLRRGFEVHGYLNTPADVDVYSFTAVAGTEVWVDISRTDFNLDTVVELLDANGEVLARSTSALDEILDPSLLFTSPAMPAHLVNSMQKAPPPYATTHASGLPKIFGSLNPRDAGMRIVLAGNAGTPSSYHLRVRSNHGLTSGLYQLQVRTREQIEFPGSTVRFADVRYAMNGIEVIGLPSHSPLLGEIAEDEATNGTASPFGTNSNNSISVGAALGQRPQHIGNLFVSDRAVKSIAGSLSSSADIDFYEFDLAYTSVTQPTLWNGLINQHGTLIFDMDYADNLVRPNSIVSVFDQEGRLILIGRNSNVAEDRPGPLRGPDLTDLSRGSVGPADPFIGPVAVPQGTYYVAVSSNAQLPAVLSDPLTRLEPINSVRRIADDRIGSFGTTTAEPPVVRELFDPTFVGTGNNRWQVTTNRGGPDDLGHGIAMPYDRSRAAEVGGQSFYFGDPATFTVPAGSQGNLTSNPFGLKGYSAADIPRLYFSYFQRLDVANDFFRVWVLDQAGNRGPLPLASSHASEFGLAGVQQLFNVPASDDMWRQARLDLGAFAGQDNLRLQFEVIRNGTTSVEGVYVDDIIIGFAERGEMVTGAESNADFVSNPNVPANQVLSGPYQLEIRRATDYGRSADSGPVGFLLETTIDTNDRLAQETTLIVPNGSQIRDGQTFVVSDGARSVTFEYNDPAVPGGVTPGHIEIRFSPDPANPDFQDHVIARRIRDAINSPTVQSLLKVTAATSDGVVTGTASTSNRINLFGNAIVAQPTPFQVTETTTNANLLRDAIVRQFDPFDPLHPNRIVPVGNAVYVGGSRSAGFFAGGRDSIGLEGGILLTTGDAMFANGPNRDDGSTGRSSEQGDADLDAEFGLTPAAGLTEDATSLEFDFQFGDGFSSDNHLYLNFVFASEEYNEFANDQWGDVMAIFVNGVNIGLLPTGERVSVNTVNGGNPLGAGAQNPEFFVNNSRTEGGQFVDQVGYDGFTVRLEANTVDAFPGGLGPGTHRIKIVVSDVGDLSLDSAVLIEAGSVSPAPTPLLPEGIPSVRHQGQGDKNVFRDQGQVLIHSNTVSHSRDFGIVARPAPRERDDMNRPVGAPSPGPARNLRELNDLANTGAKGGVAPGVVIMNNTLVGNDLGGIHVAGDLRPYELRMPANEDYPLPPVINRTSADAICDGDWFRLTVGRQTIEFEFEDIAGSGTSNETYTCGIGSGAPGGNGWTPGRVPVFYRRSVGNTLGFNEQQMALAIANAIERSTLITNDTSLVARVTAALGLSQPRDTGPGGGFGFPHASTYVEHASDVQFFAISGAPSRRSAGVTPLVSTIGHAAQPFHRVVNNTIFGNDGFYSFFPDEPLEPNDTIANAVDTRQGPQHNPESYRRTGLMIGDSQNFVVGQSRDVDFYKFQLNIGDRVTIGVDAESIGSPLDAVLRLFNARGEELDVSTGQPDTRDPFIDFTATVAGTYYVGVSGAGNETYDPLSLGGRVASDTSGEYDIDINVWAPRRWVIDTRTLVGAGTSTFTIANVDNEIGSVSVTSGSTAPANNTPALVRSLVAQINALPGVTATELGLGPTAPTTGNVLTRSVARYVVIEGAAVVTGGPSQSLLPRPNANENGVLRETGILVSNEATPTLMNNVLSNLRNGIIEVEHQPHVIGGAVHQLDGFTSAPSPRTAVQTGQIFQYNTGPGHENVPALNMAISGQRTALRGTPGVGALIGPVELLIPRTDNSDFNIPLGPNEPLFVNALAGNLFPARLAKSIDSSVDSLSERSQLITVKQPMGIGLSPILAPDRDAVGQLRVDDPEVDTPQGLGGNVFKDRGSLDRSDFVGPNAVLLNPRDNDALGIDLDPSGTVVQVSHGVFSQFLLQVVDGFEAADPFPGVGVDDDTVSGRAVIVEHNGVQFEIRGPAVTIFQNGRFLQEGLDYTFSYNSTSNTIRLTPMSGIWRDDSVYVIRLNNRDRFVIDAPTPNRLQDGDTFTITGDDGSTAMFEFDRGYSMIVPVTPEIRVPFEGAGPGGIEDGERLTVNMRVGVTRQNFVFEFDKNTPPNILPSSNFRIDISNAITRDEVADAVVDALVANLGLGARNLGDGRIHLGLLGTQVVDTNQTKLSQPPETQTFLVPAVGVGPAGVQDGQTFTIAEGGQTTTFEFDQTPGAVGNVAPGNVRVNISNVTTATGVADAMVAAILTTNLELNPVHIGDGVVYLGASSNHVASRGTSPLRLVGGAQTIADGETFTIQSGSDPAVTFEFDFGDGVASGSTPILISSTDTQDDIGNAVVVAVRNANVGMTPLYLGNGQVHLGGDPGHVINTTLSPSLNVPTSPGVEGPLRLTVPQAGGNDAQGGIRDGDTFVIDDGTNVTTFEFDLDTDNNITPGNVRILYQLTSTRDQIADAIVAAINNANIGLNPQHLGNGVVDIGGSFGHQLGIPNNPTATPPEPVLEISGVPGGAIPIIFTPIPEFDVAASIVQSINRNPLSGLPPLPGVSAALRGGSTLFVDFVDSQGNRADFNNGRAAIATGGGTISTFFLPAIKDLPGNTLKANQVTDETEFTILLPGVKLDFGDAPDPLPGTGGAGRYPTLFVHDGARHVITDDPLTLGTRIDADNDGQPSIGAVGDDIDHRVDVSGSNVTMTGRAPYTVRMPAAGGSAIVDGETFTITALGAAATTFEFRLSAGTVTPGNQGIIYSTSDTANVLAGKVTDAIRAANLGLLPANLGGGVVHIGGRQVHTFDPSDSPIRSEGLPPYLLSVPQGGGNALINGQTFVLSDGQFTKRFEFDAGNGLLDPTNVGVPFDPTDTPEQIALNMIAALGGQGLAISMTSLGGGLIYVEGPTSHLLDLAGSSLRHNGNAPARLQTPGAALSLGITLTQKLLVPTDGAADVTDGDRFVIDDRINDPVTFEFQTSAADVTPGNQGVIYVTSDTQDQLAGKIVATIEAAVTAGLLEAMSPAHLGGGVIELLDASSGEGTNVSLDTSLGAMDQSGPVADGDEFVVTDSMGNSVTFEFDSDGSANNTAIGFTLADPVDQIARSIVAAIDAATTGGSLSGVQAINLGRGVVEFRANAGATLTADNAALLVADGVGGGVADGQFLIVDNGNQVFRFEFDRNGLFTPGNHVIPYTADSTAEDVAQAMIAAFTSAGLDMHAAHLGDGLVDINANDDDGVLIGGVFNRGIQPGTQITIFASGSGFIDAWIDFNADGDWNDPGEKILDSVPVTAGANTFFIQIPPTTSLITDSTGAPHVTYARFRLSSQGELLPTGLALDGEVEDYQVLLVPGSPPIVNDDTYTTAEDQPLVRSAGNGVLANDSDPDGNPMTAILRSQPNNGTVELNADGSFTYTPDPDFNGVDFFTYQAHDGTMPSNATATVTITVTEVNDPPIANDIVFVTDEDQTWIVDQSALTENDFAGPPTAVDELETQTLTVISVEILSPAGGSVSLVNGQITYQPPQDYNGLATLRYVIEDDGTTNGVLDPLTATATVTLVIQEINDPPVIGPISRVTTEDIPLDINIANVMTNVAPGPPTAVDEMDQTVAFVGVIDAAGQVGTTGVTAEGGTVTVVGGNIRYVPLPDFFGTDFIPFVVTDQGGTSRGVPDQQQATGTITVTVIEVNDEPIANDVTISGPPVNPTMNETVTFAATLLTANDLPGPPNESDQTLTVVAVGTENELSTTTSGGGTITLDLATQQLVYEPLPDFFGSDTFVYVVEDDGQTAGVDDFLRATATVTIDVRPVNAPPVAEDDHVVGDEDTALTIPFSTLLANDSSGPGEPVPITITQVSTSTPGATVTLDADSEQVIYTPPQFFFGNDTFTYVLSDGEFTDTGTVTVEVREFNNPPIPVDDNFPRPGDPPILEDSVLTLSFGDLTANDAPGPANESNQTLTVISVAMTPQSAADGTVSIAGGQVIFTPTANFNGIARFTYVVQDNGTTRGVSDPKTATGTVTVTVAEVNDPPVANDVFLSGTEDVAMTIPQSALTANDSPGPPNEAGQTLTVVRVFPAENGTVTLDNGVITYVPNPDFNGTDTFLYEVQDNGTTNGQPDPKSAFATVTISLSEVNDPPIANDDHVNAVEDVVLTINSVDLLANDLPGPPTAIDELNQQLSVIGVAYFGPNGSTVTLSPGGSTITYRPGANFNGVETFTYFVEDNGTTNGQADPQRATGTVTVTVSEVNDPPVAVSDTVTTAEDTPLTITGSNLLANDRPGPANEPAATLVKESDQTIELIGAGPTSAWNGTVVFDADTGTVIYTPAQDFNGVDTFTYVIRDNGTTAGEPDPKTATGTVTVTVTAVNDPPIPGDNTISTLEDIPVSVLEGDLLANDVPGPPNEAHQTLTLISVSSTSAAGGTVTRVGATITYTPPQDYNGIDTFTYVIEDDGLTNNEPDPQRATGTVTVSIAPVNDPPFVASPPPVVNVLENSQPVQVNLAGVFDDPDIHTNDDVLTLSIASNSRPSLVTATIDGTTLNLTFAPFQNGSAVIAVRATDLEGLSVTADVQVNVTPVNNPPQVVNPLPDITVLEDAPNTSIELFPNVFVDPDNDPLTFRVLSNTNPSLLSATISGTRLILSYLPNQNGTATITIEAEDPEGLRASDSFAVTVQPVNDPPVAVNDSYIVTRGQPFVADDPFGTDGNPNNNGVLANDFDIDSPSLSAFLVNTVSHGTLQFNSNGTFTYTHDGGPATQDSFSYRAFDGQDFSNVATVTLQIENRFQNPENRFDVNGDGVLSPIDALLVINHLNRLGAGPLPSDFVPPPFVDVNGDGLVSPVDVNMVINELNRLAGMGMGGEGEASGGDVASSQLLAASESTWLSAGLPALEVSDAVDARFGNAGSRSHAGSLRHGDGAFEPQMVFSNAVELGSFGMAVQGRVNRSDAVRVADGELPLRKRVDRVFDDHATGSGSFERISRDVIQELAGRQEWTSAADHVWKDFWSDDDDFLTT